MIPYIPLYDPIITPSVWRPALGSLNSLATTLWIFLDVGGHRCTNPMGLPGPAQTPQQEYAFPLGSMGVMGHPCHCHLQHGVSNFPGSDPGSANWPRTKVLGFRSPRLLQSHAHVLISAIGHQSCPVIRHRSPSPHVLRAFWAWSRPVIHHRHTKGGAAPVGTNPMGLPDVQTPQQENGFLLGEG